MNSVASAGTANGASLRISVIVGSIGYRRILTTLIRSALPHARIEDVDPYSQTMRGSGLAFGGVADVIVLGGIGTEAEALSALQRLRARDDCSSQEMPSNITARASLSNASPAAGVSAFVRF